MATKQDETLNDVVRLLRDAAGENLLSVTLHGAEARGDHFDAIQDLHLLVVLKDLDLATLAPLRGAIKRWLKRGNPMPRFFSPGIIANGSDVFCLEFLDIAQHHRVLHGIDPFTDLAVSTQSLRLQCERGLRLKLMRLQEAYIETKGRPSDLRHLLTISFLDFVDIFRACLRLHDQSVPASTEDTVSAFCTIAKLDPLPFQVAHQLAQGESPDQDFDDIFARYYLQLSNAVHLIDTFGKASS